MRDFSSCSFCNELFGEPDNNFYEIYLREEFKKNGLTSRIVAETKNFVILPMVGPLVPGYLLILPRRHVQSFSFLSEDELREAVNIKTTIKRIFEKEFGRSVVYEHGALTNTLRGGCCSDHAHLHIVAVDVNVDDEFQRFGFEVRKLNDFLNISRQVERNSPYLFYENQLGEQIIMDVDVIESQFIRKLIASKIDASDRALWNKNIQLDWMIQIIKQMKPFFEPMKGVGIWK